MKIWLQLTMIRNVKPSVTVHFDTMIEPEREVWAGTGSMKALANKNAILIIAFQTPQHFTYFGWTVRVEFFPGVDRESSYEVCKMLGWLKCKYENCLFICQCLYGLGIRICCFTQGQIEQQWTWQRVYLLYHWKWMLTTHIVSWLMIRVSGN